MHYIKIILILYDDNRIGKHILILYLPVWISADLYKYRIDFVFFELPEITSENNKDCYIFLF
jgi:hypothetical protein